MTTSDQSFTSDDLYVDHLPTLELVLDHEEQRGDEEMPTIAMARNKSRSRRNYFLPNRFSSPPPPPQEPMEPDTLVIEEFDPEAIEAQSMASWNFCLDADSTPKQTRGGCRRKTLCLLIVCVLVAGAVLALVSGQENEERSSEVAKSITSPPGDTVETAPVEDPPAEDPPAEDPPAEDDPAEDDPAEDDPAEDDPAEDDPAEDDPAEDDPAEDDPAEDDPAEDDPAEDDPAEDDPAEDDPADVDPTSAPEAPGDGDTTCTTTVQSDLDCYEFQTSIDISFDNCEPVEDDWIGIYAQDSNVDLNNLGDPLTWLWNCGSQSCRGEVLVDTLPFGDDLEVGTYVAYMIRRNSGGPYSSYAASSSFDIATTC
jgi:hypothetical protein